MRPRRRRSGRNDAAEVRGPAARPVPGRRARHRDLRPHAARLGAGLRGGAAPPTCRRAAGKRRMATAPFASKGTVRRDASPKRRQHRLARVDRRLVVRAVQPADVDMIDDDRPARDFDHHAAAPLGVPPRTASGSRRRTPRSTSRGSGWAKKSSGSGAGTLGRRGRRTRSRPDRPRRSGRRGCRPRSSRWSRRSGPARRGRARSCGVSASPVRGSASTPGRTGSAAWPLGAVKRCPSVSPEIRPAGSPRRSRPRTRR